MVQTPVARTPTLEDFLGLPETKPGSEYFDGQITQKPMPQGEHSVLQTELASALNLALKPQKLGRAFSELRCTFEGSSIIPDISVFEWDRIPRKENGGVANIFSITPDWAIEILSPNQSQTKLTKKILYCLQQGTQMGWLIDPSEQSVLIYSPDQPTRVYDRTSLSSFSQGNDALPVPEFAKNFCLTVEGLFAWLLD